MTKAKRAGILMGVTEEEMVWIKEQLEKKRETDKKQFLDDQILNHWNRILNEVKEIKMLGGELSFVGGSYIGVSTPVSFGGKNINSIQLKGHLGFLD